MDSGAAPCHSPNMPFTCQRCGAVSHNPNDEREGYCGSCHRYADEGVDSLLREFLTNALDEHTPHVDSGEFFPGWRLDEDGNLRCPLDDELVVPSVKWLSR